MFSMLDEKRHLLATVVAATAIGTVTALAGTSPSSAATSAPTAATVATSVDPYSAAAARGLLSESQMPKVNEVQRWTRLAEPRRSRTTVCQFGSIQSLKAPGHARRDFRMPGARASNVVLKYRTRTAAAAAYNKVRSWRSYCDEGLPAGAVLLYRGPHKPVATPYGPASYFQITWKASPSAEEGWFEWVGVTRRGARVSIVTWRVGGMDANYDVDPTIAALKNAHRKLARV